MKASKCEFWFRDISLAVLLAISLQGVRLNAIGEIPSTSREGSSEKPEQIVIGITPGGDPNLIRSQSLELAKELQNELEIPVNIYVSKNYKGLSEAMRTKKVDFGFFSTVTYILKEKEANAKVLLKKVYKEPFYYSALVTLKSSQVHSVKDLKNKKIAFVDTQSASGYLYPWLILKKNKIDKNNFKEVLFTGNHHDSVDLLERKKVDVIAVFSDDPQSKTGAWTKFAKDKKSQFKVLWTSEPIPNDPFCVRNDFYEKYPKLTHTLMFALIDLFEKGQRSSKYSEVLGLQTLIPATTRQYESVREVVKNLGQEIGDQF